ncbi:MAG: DUF5991 domain-containing protein [Candidatus Paceibacterota bacterium]
MKEQSQQQPEETQQLDPTQKPSILGKPFIFFLTILVAALAGAGLLYVTQYVSKDIKNQGNKVSTIESEVNFDWDGSYSFSEVADGGPGSVQSWTYELTVVEVAGEWQAQLSIDGFQTLTRINATAIVSQNSMDVVFDSFAPENGNLRNLVQGDVLFTLHPTSEGLRIEWKKLQPNREKSLNTSVFEKVINLNKSRINFDPGRSHSPDTVVSSNGLKTARATQDGLIFITNFSSKNKESVIDVLQGSTTIPGMSVPDYSSQGYGFQKAYFHGVIAFIDNDNLLYPKSSDVYIIKNVETGEERMINGDVVEVFGDSYLVYTKYKKDSGSSDNDYILHDLKRNTETVFFPEARVNNARLMRFSLCNEQLRFVQFIDYWPTAEERDYTYYVFDIESKELTKIGESRGLQMAEEFIDKLDSCI